MHFQADGSLVLQCSFTVGKPSCGGLHRRMALLRESGKSTLFRIISPGGNEFTVSTPTVVCMFEISTADTVSKGMQPLKVLRFATILSWFFVFRSV